MLGDGVGRDEYIDQKHGRFRQIKAAGGRAVGRRRSGFGALFTQINKYGEQGELA